MTKPTATATATIHTSKGDIAVELYGNQAPETVKSFRGLADGSARYTTENARGTTEGPFYNGSIFHRVIDGFMIQGGDPTGTGTGGPGYMFADEFSPELTFDRPYLLAMANPGRPNMNGSQFFITLVPTPHLNPRQSPAGQVGHTIFGEVVDEASKKVVDEIGSTKTRPGDRPVDDIVIESITVEPK